MKLVKDGGYLATCSCSHYMDYENFTRVIHQAAASAHKRLRQVEFRTQAADHPILARKALDLEMLCTEEFVLTEQDMSYRKLLDRELATRSMEVSPVLEIGNPLQICEIVKNSRLLSFLPDFISQGYVQSGQLQTLDVADCQVKVWTQLLIHKNKWRSSALSAFISYYRNVMQE